jgi:hypothetical protein
MNDVVEQLTTELAEGISCQLPYGDLPFVSEVIRKAYQAGADSVKAEAELINETVEQIAGRREDGASDAMAQVMLLQFSRLTGKQTITVTVDLDTVLNDLRSTLLTKTAPSEHEITYTLDVLP